MFNLLKKLIGCLAVVGIFVNIVRFPQTLKMARQMPPDLTPYALGGAVLGFLILCWIARACLRSAND